MNPGQDVTPPDDDSVDVLASDKAAEPLAIKPVDATGWRLSDSFIKASNLLLKLKFFFFLVFKGSRLDRPYYVHYQITRRCNFRCVSCRTWRDETFDKGLTLDQMRLAAENLRKVGLKSIALTGGEPLLRKDIIQIIEIFRKAGFIIRFQTNGFLLSEGLLEQLFRAGVADLFISFDSLDPETFNRINGLTRPDAFARVKKSIETAAATSKRFGANVFLTAILRKDNAGETAALHDFAKDLDVLIGIFGMEIPARDDPMNIRVNDPSLREKGEDRERLKETFEDLVLLKKSEGNRLSLSLRLLGDFLEFYSDPDRGMHWKCRAGKLFMAMLPDGAVSVCNGTPPIPGYDYRNLSELYQSPDRDGLFDEFRQSCGGCICMRQLEYIAEDKKDLFEKARMFSKSMLGIS